MGIRILLIFIWMLACVAPAAAQDNDGSQLLARINALRQQNGLPPLEPSNTLTTAAQRHSDDMARTGNVDHTGSDGSTIDSRIRAAGYGHWRDFGIWGENIYGGPLANVDAAWNFWINSQVHRANLLNPRYREIGIGVGHSDKGAYYTLNFGAQPNTLPYFVSGAAPIVTLLLTNENDITTGEGVAIMGQATEVRIAEGVDTGSASWQPWAQLIPFQLSDAPGPKTITVEYRDELGRGIKMSRTIDVSSLASATPTAEPSATPTLKPTAARTATASPTGAILPTSTVTPQATATLQPTKTLQPIKTPAPLPTATPLPTGTPTAAPTGTPTALPTSTPTIEPTAVPAPIVLPSPTATSTPQLVAANLATLPAGSRLTPPAPRPAPTERPLFAFEGSPGANTFALVIGLQVIVLGILCAAAAVRLRRH